MRRVRNWLFRTEVVFSLALGWFLVFRFPFRLTARLLGTTLAAEDPATAIVGQIPERRARGVAAAIVRASDRLPWSCTCLVRAIAGQIMLRRRGVPSGIRLGVCTDEGHLQAHAWLMAGGKILLGDDVVRRYHPIAQIQRMPCEKS